MKIILDCEFTQLNASAKLISLALVAEDGRELYVELTDSYELTDCSAFVIEHVLPLLDLDSYGCTVVTARERVAKFIAGAGDDIQICSDAPGKDWAFLCELMSADGQWPANTQRQPLDLVEMYNEMASDGLEIEVIEPPHHALLDARQLAHIYRSVIA